MTDRRPSWLVQGVHAEGEMSGSVLAGRIPFQPFRLFDLVDFVAFDHVGTSGHVDHGLVESAVCVEFVHSNVVSVEFAESFGLVGVEVEVVYVQRVAVDGGRDQMLHASLRQASPTVMSNEAVRIASSSRGSYQGLMRFMF